MKKIIICASFVLVLIAGFVVYQSNSEVGYLEASFVPNQKQNLLQGYIQLIHLKGNTATTFFHGKEEKGSFTKNDQEIIITFEDQQMTLKKDGGVYRDQKTKIEYGLRNS